LIKRRHCEERSVTGGNARYREEAP